MALRPVLLLATLGSAHAAMGWVKAATGNLCAGIDEDCNSVETCTVTAVGPCAAGDTATSTTYLQSSYVGMAFVEEGYLTDSTKAKIVEPDSTTPNGYRDYAGGKATDDGGEYAFTMTGGRYGDMSTVGGYIGIASYFNTGTQDITTSKVTVHTSDDENTGYVTSAGTGNYGAPIRDIEVCISEVTNGACTGTRTFTPGTYKFSIFGWTKGSAYPPTKGSDGFPQYTHLGVRMKLQAVGFSVDDLKVNGDVALADIGSTDVTSITIIAGDETLNIDFPKEYNYGDVLTGAVKDPDGTKTVGIKVSANDESSIFIDYLFETADLSTALRYFVYDPDVSVSSSSPPVDDSTPPPDDSTPPPDDSTPPPDDSTPPPADDEDEALSSSSGYATAVIALFGAALAALAQ